MSELRIAVIDDHPLFREGVIRSLGSTGKFAIVGQGSSAADAVRIAEEVRPDIILVDLSMPGEGLRAIQPIRSAAPQSRIVVLTVSESSESVASALNQGASGYVLKGVGGRALAEILIGVASGETYVSPSLSAQMLAHLVTARAAATILDPMSALSTREKDVLTLASAGLSNKEIARQLDLREKTIKHHMSGIFEKLQVKNRTEAAMIFHGVRSKKS